MGLFGEANFEKPVHLQNVFSFGFSQHVVQIHHVFLGHVEQLMMVVIVVVEV